jgi:hypothetical protein
MRTWRPALALNLAVKALLVALLLFGTFSGLERFEGKAFGARALTYPIAALIVPVAWWLVRRRRREPVAYPYALDVLLVLPFLIDVIGNALDLYDSIGWWDDANHFVNWGLLTAGFGQLLVRLRLPRWNAGALAVGFGGVTAIVWELAEYWTFIRNSPELRTAYTDTLGDLSLGLGGSVVAATLTVTALWPRRGS